MSRKEIRLELDIVYFQAMSKIVQFGRSINAFSPPIIAKIFPLQALAHEVIR